MMTRPLQDQVAEIAVLGAAMAIMGFLAMVVKGMANSAFTETPALLPATAIRYLTILDAGDTTFKEGEVISLEAYEKENRRVRIIGLRPAFGKRLGDILPGGYLASPKVTPVTKLTPEQEASNTELQRIVDKWEAAKARHSVRAEADLAALEARDFDVEDARVALEEYTEIERAEFDSVEDYSDARTDAWDNFTDELDNIERLTPVIPEVTSVTPKVTERGDLIRIADKYGWWATNLAQSVCPHNDTVCIEREARRLVEARKARLK